MATHLAVGKIPKCFWKNLNHQRQAFDTLAKERNIVDASGWYKLHTKTLLSHRGITSILNNYYKGCLYKALTSLYPDQRFEFWKFVRVPKHFWTDKVFQKQFLDSVEKTLGIEHKDGWYSVDGKRIKELGGGSLLYYFGGSVPLTLAQVYPEYNWKMWLFKDPPSKYWEDSKNQRAFMDWLAGELGITHFEQWYRVSIQQVREKGGGSMVARFYQSSLPKALQNIYPEHPWQLWRFQYCRVPVGFYDHDHNAYAFLKWFSEQYGITNMNDWYTVSRLQFDKAGGFSLRTKHGDLSRVLMKYFPEHNWNFQASRDRLPSKAQVHLERVVQSIFPHEELKTNCRIKNIAYLDTQREMEFDMYIPKHNLIFEYQGEQHYIWSTLCGSVEIQHNKDIAKKKACAEAGITMIEIPFWWDRQKSSILATILKHRPDLAAHIPASASIGTAIAEEVPKKYLNQRAPAYLDKFTEVDGTVEDPTGWWLCYAKGTQVKWNGREFEKPVEPSAAAALQCAFPANTIIEGTLYQEGGITRFILTDARTESLLESDTDQRITLLQTLAAQVSRNLPNGIQVEVAQFAQIQNKQDLLLQYSKAEESGASHIVLEPPHLAHADVSAVKLTGHPLEYGLVVGVEHGAIKCQLSNESTYVIKIPKDSKLQQLKEGSVVSFNYLTLDKPTAANIEWKPTMSWSDVEQLKKRAATPYMLTLGRASGHFPKCQGCGKWIADRKLPRIQVKAAYRSSSRPYPHPIKLTLCADVQCIEKATKLIKSKKVRSVYLPPFQHQIGVPLRLKGVTGSLHVPNVQWVDIL